MRKGRVCDFRHFAAQRAGEALCYVFACEIRQGEEVGEFGEGGFGGEIEAKDDAYAAELCAWCVDGGDEAGDALRDVDDDDAALDGGLYDVGETTVRTAGDVAHAKGFEDEAPKVREVEDRVDHLGLDAGEDADAGHVRGVEVFLDLELCDTGWTKDEWPVDGDAQAVDLGERLVVGRGEGLKRS